MKLRVVPGALSLILSGGIPGLIAVMPASAAAAKSAYAMTDLGNPGEGVSLGFGINASGEVVGRSHLDTVFFFKCGRQVHAERPVQLDVFMGSNGFTLDNATAINDNGQIVASGSNAQDQEHAFLLTQLVSAPRIYRPPA
jgi:probable HAF family extracellular repeat protein